MPGLNTKKMLCKGYKMWYSEHRITTVPTFVSLACSLRPNIECRDGDASLLGRSVFIRPGRGRALKAGLRCGGTLSHTKKSRVIKAHGLKAPRATRKEQRNPGNGVVLDPLLTGTSRSLLPHAAAVGHWHPTDRISVSPLCATVSSPLTGHMLLSIRHEGTWFVRAYRGRA